MDPTIDEMLIVSAAALRRHQQHLEDGYDQHRWHVLARYLIVAAWADGLALVRTVVAAVDERRGASVARP